MTMCSPLKVNQCFGGTYRIHLQGRRISRARDQQGLHGVISRKTVLFNCHKRLEILTKVIFSRHVSVRVFYNYRQKKNSVMYSIS
jgi:hypothetical protein